MVHEFYPQGVCSMRMIIDVDDNTKIVNSVKIIGGCAGNTQGVSVLVQGMHIDDVISRLKGIDCRGRGTSCPDQLAIAMEEIKAKLA